MQERTQALKRWQKVLESATSKLGTIATDLLGVSGRAIAMREALIADHQRPAEMAELARGRRRRRMPALRQALEGRVTPQHRLLLRQMLTHLEFLEQAIGQVQAQLDRQLEPSHEALTLLQTIPGMSALTAAAILAEIGGDMTRFPSACAAQAPRFVGGAVSGQHAEWRETPASWDDLRQALVTRRVR